MPSSALLVCMLCAQVSGAAGAGTMLFESPSVAGTTGFPSDFQGFGEQSQNVLGKNGDDGWRGSVDGGATWKIVLGDASGGHIQGDAPGQHAVVAAGPGTLHNMGNATVVSDLDAGYKSFSSNFVQQYHVQGGGFFTRKQLANVTFQGLPDPVTCGNTQHLFGCPFRTSGIGHVALPSDKSLVMSTIVYWAGTHASPNATVRETATSVIAFRSRDGYSWNYTGTILDAAGVPESEEGPNQVRSPRACSNCSACCNGSTLPVLTHHHHHTRSE
jgi:hypothetical protein